jgi:hypothetical protein
MLEKPKSLRELSEYEFQNLASYLAGEWWGVVRTLDTAGRNFFVMPSLARCQIGSQGGSPLLKWKTWFPSEREGSQTITLSLLKDAQRN